MDTRIPWLLTRTLRSVRHDDETKEWVFNFGEGYVLQAAAITRCNDERRGATEGLRRW
jgi:hypothetical protein